jgi:hypothetical protein
MHFRSRIRSNRNNARGTDAEASCAARHFGVRWPGTEVMDGMDRGRPGRRSAVDSIWKSSFSAGDSISSTS